MKKVISKGYTISVTSWENDGDNYKTKSITVATEKEAKAVHDMCKTLFKSCNNGDGGIGNMMDDEGDEAREVILDYIESHPEIKQGKDLTEDQAIDLVLDYNYKLMGGSEYYYSRVFDSIEITYTENDVYSKEIKF